MYEDWIDRCRPCELADAALLLVFFGTPFLLLRSRFVFYKYPTDS